MYEFRKRVEGLEGVPKRRFQIFWTKMIEKKLEPGANVQPQDWDTMQIKDEFGAKDVLFEITGEIRTADPNSSFKASTKPVHGYTTFRKYAAIMQQLYKWEVKPHTMTDDSLHNTRKNHKGIMIPESFMSVEHEWCTPQRMLSSFHTEYNTICSLFSSSIGRFRKTRKASQPQAEILPSCLLEYIRQSVGEAEILTGWRLRTEFIGGAL
jgi:hypothetical protein